MQKRQKRGAGTRQAAIRDRLRKSLVTKEGGRVHAARPIALRQVPTAVRRLADQLMASRMKDPKNT